MTLSIALAAMMLLVLVYNMSETPVCGDCGNRFKHAEDCWRKKWREGEVSPALIPAHK